MKDFNKSEAKKLFDFIKEKNESNNSLTKSFKEYASMTGRAQGSVRNYYYKTIKECKENEKLRLKLGVSKEMFPEFVKEFNEAESLELLTIVLKGIASGKSVRSVISSLANNNDKLALRYQNKYRNLLKNQKQLVLKVAKKIKCKDGSTVNPYKEESDEIKKIEIEIDNLVKRIFYALKAENDMLNERITKLTLENQKLKNLN